MPFRLPVVIGPDGLPQQLQQTDVLLTDQYIPLVNMATRLIQTQSIVALIVQKANL